MDTFRRAVLPALVIVVLLAAFVFRLSSCASDDKTSGASPAAETPASPSVSDAEAATAAVNSPTPPYSAKEIKRIYESLGLTVAEIRDAGDYTMVHYYKPTGVPGEIISRFDWFERETGARELVCGWAYTEEFEIRPDKSLTVLTTGRSYIDGALSFPEIYKAGYEEIDGALMFIGSEEKYYAPIEKSYTLGSDRHTSLTGVHFNSGFLSLGFGPQPGYEGEFYAADASIPKVNVQIAEGIATVTLYHTIPSAGFGEVVPKENPYCSSSSLSTDGTDTVITLRLNDSVTRYNVSTEYSPENRFPYAVIEFTSQYFDYPAGW